MSSTDAAAPVNSRLWWEDYFADQWDANDGRSQTAYFMRQLAENLPAREREYLSSREATILDWGCAFGDGVDVLATAFPRCRVVGMDFAERAIAEAQRSFPRHEFRHMREGEIGDRFDVVVTSNCLEHFAEPLPVIRQHLECCRSLYVALVPYREAPLLSCHMTRFDEECFPESLEGFTRIAMMVLDCDPAHWRGRQLLVVYGSRSYLLDQGNDERRKWDDYCASLPTLEIADALALMVAAERRCKQAEHRCKQLEDDLRKRERAWTQGTEKLRGETEKLRGELDAITGSRAWALIEKWRAVRLWLALRGSRLESAARLPWRAARLLASPRTLFKALARPILRRLPLRLQYRIQSAVAAAHGWRLRTDLAPGDLAEPTEVRGLVSVVLPVYNHADLLPGAVESVLAQTYRDWELIIVDDGSSDGVEQVLADYAGHPQVRVLVQANQKLPKALSNGFEFARGEFRTWTSADNLMHPDQLRRQVEFLQAHPEIGMVYADYTAIDAEGRPLVDASFRPHNRRGPHDPNIHLPHTVRVFGKTADNFIGPCFMYRSWIGRLLGEYDPTLGIEDFDYWLRLSLVAHIAHLDDDQPLYQYRVHQNSLSGRAEELQIPEHAQRLMGYHRRRQEFHARPWTIHADAATLAWLDETDARPHRVARWSGEQLASQEGEKHLLLVHCESLPAAAESRRCAKVPLVAWFPADAHAAGQYRAESQTAADLCFAEDDATAARLALVTPRVLCAAPGLALLTLATKWANGQVFYQTTRPSIERVRGLPRVFRPKGRNTRVLLQADDFTQGGMEQVILDLARYLRTEDFDVSLLVLGKQGPDADKARGAGIPVVSLPEKNRAHHYRSLLKEQRIDVVSAHYSLFGARITAEQGVPFVQTIHNTYIFLPPNQIMAYRANDFFTSAYTCVSQMAAHYTDVKLGLPVSKMVLTPNGIDLARLDAAAAQGARQALRRELGLRDEDFIFLNVSSLQPIKCQATLVCAFAEVVRAFPQARLLLLGHAMNPAYLAQVKRAIAREGLENAVLLAGHRDDTARFYAAADAFVLPSLCEGWSLALNEAIAVGLPVVATGVGSAPELLPLVGGRLVRPPLGDITNVDFFNMCKYAALEDPKFVAELAEALMDVCRRRPRPLVSSALRRRLDWREAYKPYGQLFLWLSQGGHPSAARPWAA